MTELFWLYIVCTIACILLGLFGTFILRETMTRKDLVIFLGVSIIPVVNLLFCFAILMDIHSRVKRTKKWKAFWDKPVIDFEVRKEDSE